MFESRWISINLKRLKPDIVKTNKNGSYPKTESMGCWCIDPQSPYLPPVCLGFREIDQPHWVSFEIACWMIEKSSTTNAYWMVNHKWNIMIITTKTFNIPSLKLTARTWKLMVGRIYFPFGWPIFRGVAMLVLGRVQESLQTPHFHYTSCLLGILISWFTIITIYLGRKCHPRKKNKKKQTTRGPFRHCSVGFLLCPPSLPPVSFTPPCRIDPKVLCSVVGRFCQRSIGLYRWQDHTWKLFFSGADFGGNSFGEIYGIAPFFCWVWFGS